MAAKNTAQLTLENGRYVITYRGKVIYTRPTKKVAIANFNANFLTSRYAKKWNCQVIPELVDLTDEAEVETGSVTSEETTQAAPPKAEFTVGQRFDFIKTLGAMVLQGCVNSVIVSGPGGLGKTHTVMELIKEAKLMKDYDFITISGMSTPKALYRQLYTHNGKVFIIDDCDAAFKDPQAANLLKAALDSKPIRKVCWLTERVDDELPESFEFTGRVFFITNIPLGKFSQALRSRAYGVDLNMTNDEKIERMEAILPEMCLEYDDDMKKEALDYVREIADEIPDLNFRTLEKVIKIRAGAGKMWKELAKYSVMEG